MSITLIGPAQIPSMGFGTFQLEQDTVADLVARGPFRRVPPY